MEQERVTLTPYLSRGEAWALSLGTSIGWGSLVITCSTYLASAGPAGTIGGLLLGGLVMLLIARNYHYLMNAFPDAGGVYTYAQSAFGHDFGFLTAWFVLLTYLAMLWANATSLPLFARYFMGGAFEFGHLYQVFGYEVYLGEALLSMGAIVVAALFCIAFKKGAARAMVLLAVTLAVGIVGCTLASLGGHATQSYAFEPLFVPGTHPSLQVLRIACISPWASPSWGAPPLGGSWTSPP